MTLRARELLYQFTADATAEARSLFEESIRLDPGYSNAYSGIAIAMHNEFLSCWNGATEETLADGFKMAEKAVVLNPDDAIARCTLGIAHMWTKDFERSEAQLTRAIESVTHAMLLNPEFPKLYLHFLAHAYFMKEDYERAAELLERRIRLNPGTDISRVLLAACYGYLGRAGESVKIWNEALAINPGYSLKQKATVLPFKDPADWQRVVDGLSKAGVTEE